MGTQTMGSQGVGNPPPFPKSSSSSSLSRQSSLYNLTLDEVQNQLGRNLGKPLSSMNLDELLRTVWIAESNPQTSTVGGNAIVDSNEVLNHGGKAVQTTTSQSSFSLSQDLSMKTVDDVWREIQQGKKCSSNNNLGRRKSSSSNEEREHNSLGEMTLEDFLVHAGIVNVEAGNNIGTDLSGGEPNVNLDVPQQSWMPYQHQLLPQQMSSNSTMFIAGEVGEQHNHVVCGGLAVQDSGYSEPQGQIVLSSSPLIGSFSDTQAPGRKRVASGDVVEKIVERRQKRMIKNRESAARSRARKQAYTNELENKISRLEEENERLRKMKEVEKGLPPPPQPKYQHRRTNSAPF